MRKFSDKFAEKLAKKSSELKVSDGRKDGAQIGPLITMAAVGKSTKSRICKNKGAKIITGGDIDNAGKQFYKPTVMTNVTNDMKIFMRKHWTSSSINKVYDEEVIKMAKMIQITV